MVFMNTNVTRGRAEMVVTETSMSTQVGHIAKMLRETKAMPTPLTKQINPLIRIILLIAAAIFVGVLVIGLARGNFFDSLFQLGVALAVGSIPDALPAVVTTVLSLGTVAMARKYAITKRLSSVETLCSTSAICSDKTGTLTMNQMTVTTLVLPGTSYHVTGHGYSTEGDIKRVAGEGATDLDSSRWNSRRCVW